ncbi:hypothetical protein GCM10010230_34620 [Streptomyces narbonensis]|nr:hypothetical protein GCM10010230_34620 [Streptomyces narbonensis]
MQPRQPDPRHDLVDPEIPHDPEHGPDERSDDTLPCVDPQCVLDTEADEPKGGEPTSSRLSGEPRADGEKDDEGKQHDAPEGEPQYVE